jgi:hypothetical protein
MDVVKVTKYDKIERLGGGGQGDLEDEGPVGAGSGDFEDGPGVAEGGGVDREDSAGVSLSRVLHLHGRRQLHVRSTPVVLRVEAPGHGV